tara:strand:- start:1093 stop:2241 length:1149 start_codon:yes stop_codon:yes gene_type:complete
MGTTGINEGHEKTGTGATWQADGLRDTDVLSTATLTNLVERGLGNGVIPLTLNTYSADSGAGSRNDPISGNCCVRPNTGGATNSIFVDQGTVCLDGLYYSVGSASAFDIDTASYYNARFNAGGMVLPTAANEECWVLVIVDPELTGTNKIGLVCGTVVDTSTGVYPQMPSSHLVKQSVVLGAVRVSYASPLVVAAVEDKRVFIRGGPIPLTGIMDGADAPSDPQNDYGTSPALLSGALPIAGLGLLFARKPNDHNPVITAPDGADQTHLFYGSDISLGPVDGGTYQITPVHRQAKEVLSYTGAGAISLALQPLICGVDPSKHLITATWFGSGGTQMCPLQEGVHYTVAGPTITMADLSVTVIAPLGPLGVGEIEFFYTHSGF